MNQVYLLEEHCRYNHGPREHEVIGVFDTKEKAESVAASITEYYCNIRKKCGLPYDDPHYVYHSISVVSVPVNEILEERML